MTVEDHYQEGLRDGRIAALEQQANSHAKRLDSHERRISAQERITYALLGAIALLEVLPTIQELMNK